MITISGNRPTTKAEFKEKLPIILKRIGKSSEDHYKLGFAQSGGKTDDSIHGWVDRMPRPKPFDPVGEKGAQRSYLTYTGKLMKSLKNRSNKTKGTATVYTNVSYATLHNHGGYSKIPWLNPPYTSKEHWSKIPKREFLGKSRENYRKNSRIIQKWLGEFGR